MPKTVDVPSYSVKIFIGGSSKVAEDICQEYCNEVGLCVNVTETAYIFKGGKEKGVTVELINYGRFPTDHMEIWGTAQNLAEKLLKDLGEQSYTIQDSKWSRWVSHRPEDN